MAKLKTQFNDLVSVSQREKVSMLFLDAPWVYVEIEGKYQWILGEEYNGKEIIVSSINEDTNFLYEMVIPAHFKNTKVLFYNYNQTPVADNTILRLKKDWDNTNPKRFLTTLISNPNFSNNLDGYSILEQDSFMSVNNLSTGWFGIEVKEETHIVEFMLANYGEL